MTISLFNRRQFRAAAPALTPATITDFSGGLNVVDNDVTMKTRYAAVLKNFQRDTDGGMSLRWGSRYKHTTTGAATGTIIEVVYFADHLVVFTTTGQIAKITEAGVVSLIWSDAIAVALVGAPDGWSPGLLNVDTTTFKSSMVVQNGIDKPLLIADDLTVDYLQDPATGSNVNTPIAKYCTTVSNFCVHAGIASAPGEIYVSATGAVGVYTGDAAPNDAININLAAYVPETDGVIIGLGSFRNTLLVMFEGAIVVVVLGNMVEDIHTPQVQDTIIEHGVLSYRTTVTTKDHFVMADTMGVHHALKNQFGLTETRAISELIEPAYQAMAPFDAATRNRCFAVFNRLERRMMFFMRRADAAMTVWTLTTKEGLKSPAWSEFEGWDWDAACASEKGRIFLAKGTRIYQYGNGVFAGEDYTADMMRNAVNGNWLTATAYATGNKIDQGGSTYVALANHTSGVFATDLAAERWVVYEGEEIVFDWELPWTDVGRRVNTKELRFIMADTAGTAQFRISAFVDNHYLDQNGDYNPAAYMDFVAGDSGGFGVGAPQPYGGGRRLRDERPYGFPARFKILKLRFHGASRYALKVITLSILYIMGSFSR